MNPANSNAPYETAQLHTSAPRKLRILAAISGKRCTEKVIEYVFELRAMNVSMEIFLLNVQPEPVTGRLRGYGSFKRNEIRDRIINDLGRPMLAYAGKQLDVEGIKHTDLVKLGDPAETILNCAHEEMCDLILLSEPAPGRIRKFVLRFTGISIGSVASVVLGLSQVPVVVARSVR